VYDSGCGLDDTVWRVAATITQVSGSMLVASAFGDYDNDYFKGGWITYGQDMRLVTSHTKSSASVTLQIPFDSRMYVGASVWTYPGCDGAPSTCKNKFNNILKFLGMPYIPSRNPILWGFR
jgi:uncharacterized phage protein (TIGR02218 family)